MSNNIDHKAIYIHDVFHKWQYVVNNKQENISIINIFTARNIVSQYIGKQLIKLQIEISKSTAVVRDLTYPFQKPFN